MEDHVRRTRYKELGYVKHSPTLWRIVDMESGHVIGPHYRSKEELLADLTRFAREYGCA